MVWRLLTPKVVAGVVSFCYFACYSSVYSNSIPGIYDIRGMMLGVAPLLVVLPRVYGIYLFSCVLYDLMNKVACDHSTRFF